MKAMETQNIECNGKIKIDIILNSLFAFIEFTMLISILIFSFFIAKGYAILGHIPFYGDTEVISYDGFDRTIVILMFYPMFCGYLLWMFLIFCGLLLGFKRKWKSIIIGLVLCVLNILAMNTSQFAWILD